MPTLIARWEHAFITEDIRKKCPDFRFLSYDRAFRLKHFKKDHYIFADLDRLSLFELELAARLYRGLRAGGAKVFNDPAQALQRFDLLKALHREGINDFNVSRPQFGDWPDRYPVFVRREPFHKGVFGNLLEDREALEVKLEVLNERGVPNKALMAIEFAAERTKDNLYRKFSVYRIGDAYFKDTSVNDRDWRVKEGQYGIASDAVYAEERASMETIEFQSTIERVFKIANIEYGRVDIGFKNGQPQFYEINTNPSVSVGLKHPNKDRVASIQIFIKNYLAAIKALDVGTHSGSFQIDDPILRAHQKSYPWFRRLRSRPTW